jgi:hypothetical protein
MVESLTGRPVRFGQANPGMQDKGLDYHASVDIGPALGLKHAFLVSAESAWDSAREVAVKFSEAFYKAGYHKQVYNRLTESFQMMKTVLSGTEMNNFFWLRDDGAADPTLAELARCMREAKAKSTPIQLQPGQFSFRNVDYGMAKCLEVFARLVGDERKHASAFEHQATPTARAVEARFNEHSNLLPGAVNEPYIPETWEPGISHVDRSGQLWSGPLRGWRQFRKLIDGENKPG